jgi:hypothetical protein
MDIVYNWVLPNGCLQTAPSDDGLTDVVKFVNWTRNGSTIANGKEYFTSVYGQYACPQPSDSDFIPYQDLQQSEVEAWLNSGLDVPNIDLALSNQLELLINPPLIVLPNPWETTTTTTTTTTTQQLGKSI